MYLAIDIGGTKTLIAVFSRRGRVVRRRKFKTAQGSRTFLADLERELGDFVKYDVRSVVVAIPGTVQKNYSVSFGNRNWDGIDLLGFIKKLFNCPIYFENDASLAALYESYRLPGRTVFLTFSTGIGGGIAEKNRILPESERFEPGHRVYEYRGARAEWEDIAARVYLGIPDIMKEHHPDTIILGGPLGKIFKLYAKYLPEMPGVRYRRPKRPLESVIYGCNLYARQREHE